MSYKRIVYLLLLCLVLVHNTTTAQRIKDPNAVGWYNVFGTISANKNISLWLEYQWRREEVITNWQQSLARVGLQYNFKNNVSAMLGYGYIVTFPYGDYPAGKYHIPEHRIFEQLVWNDNIGRLYLNHRLRLEQRFVGKVNHAASEFTLTDWLYMNRARYQLRAAIPLNHKKLEDNTAYIAGYDELFIGFGKNVNQNIFDQNRIGLLGGYQFNKRVRAEAGVFNQTVQQGGLISGQEVFQYNYGIMANLYLNL